MSTLQHEYKIYKFTLTVSLIVAMVSAVRKPWPTASCSAFDRTGCLRLYQKVVPYLSSIFVTVFFDESLAENLLDFCGFWSKFHF